MEQGIGLAAVVSLLVHVRQGYRPHTGVIVRDSADHWRIDDPIPGKEAEPGLVMFWFGGAFFAHTTLGVCELGVSLQQEEFPWQTDRLSYRLFRPTIVEPEQGT